MTQSKLFKVTIRGGELYHISFVIANNPTEAYQKVRQYLDKKDLCFRDEREMQLVKLIADSSEYPECKVMLFL